jgi:hypothetical protein
MSAELPPLENNLQPNQENAEEKIEEKNINTEPGENQVNSDFLNIYKSFDLTPFEQIIINKLLPYGIKIETEEILLKKDEKKKKGYLHRKHKKNFGNSNNILENILDNNENNIDMNLENNNNNIEKLPKRRRKKSNSSHNTENKDNNNNKSQIVMRRMTREHKPKIIEDLGYIDKDIIKGKSNPLFRAVNKVCEKGLLKIKKIQYYSFFYNYNSSKQNELSLSQIEKNIREYKYQSIYEFIMDLRKLWNFFLKMFETQNEIKEKVCEMARKSEQLYCELESINIEKVELEDLNKKVDNLEKKLREIKGSGINIGSAFNLKKNNMSERSMSLNEKTVIKNNIKLLTIEQKKGIADILRDTIDTENKKILEFDIDKLNNKTLKKLDEYVKNCIKKNNENKKIDINVEKLKQDLSDMNQRENNEIENDIEKDSISESDDSSISDSY